ncbi:NAD(P)-binding protein [Nemania sp. FL0031]|nr:NAD(P)-binding protein [Nemania sp. FL0031]
MASYLVTGASRGLGFEFIRQLSENPANIVVGLVRDKVGTDKKLVDEKLVDGAKGSNIHIVQADLVDYDSLKKSVDAVAPIVNGKLDCIIANAGLISQFSGYDDLGTLGERDPKGLENDLLECFKVNVIGNIHLFNVYMPLILKGDMKKIITISTGLSDVEMAREYKLNLGAPYGISKTAMNSATARLHAQYADQGVLFLNICPGVVDTGGYDRATAEQLEAIKGVAVKFSQYSPRFKGPITPAESVQAILERIDEASLEGDYGGRFISHLGRGEKYI